MKNHYYPKIEEWCSDTLGTWQVSRMLDRDGTDTNRAYELHEVIWEEDSDEYHVDANSYRILTQWEIDRMDWQ